ncbi:DoxX family protein [Streptomyces nigra]|uniref:DoxX family protein n=1 Tax=Streptomyces nigra TaxID=1827580 RepID=UPI00343A615B
MFVATVVISILLALLLVASGVGKLRHDRMQMETLQKVGFPESRAWLLASAEVAGATGLVIGLFWWPLGVAAAAGVAAYFVGAAVSHLRVRDYQVGPVVALLLASVAALVLRLVSA